MKPTEKYLNLVKKPPRKKNTSYLRGVNCITDGEKDDAILRERKMASQAKDKVDMYVIFQRDNFTCRYCGSSPVEDDRVKLVLDHIHPHSKEGPDTAGNLVTACSRCNGSKNNNLLSEESLEFVVEQVRERNRKNGIHDDKAIKGTHTRGGVRTRSTRFLGEEEE